MGERRVGERRAGRRKGKEEWRKTEGEEDRKRGVAEWRGKGAQEGHRYLWSHGTFASPQGGREWAYSLAVRNLWLEEGKVASGWGAELGTQIARPPHWLPSVGSKGIYCGPAHQFGPSMESSRHLLRMFPELSTAGTHSGVGQGSQALDTHSPVPGCFFLLAFLWLVWGILKDFCSRGCLWKGPWLKRPERIKSDQKIKVTWWPPGILWYCSLPFKTYL